MTPFPSCILEEKVRIPNPAIVRPLVSAILTIAVAAGALVAAPPEARPKGKSSRKTAREAAAAPSIAPGDLPGVLQGIVARRGGGRLQVGVVVLDDTGKPLASIEGDRPLAPASNQKVLIVGSALGLVGPEFAYETTLQCREAPRAGAIPELVVRGTGDPNIPNRYQDQEPTAVFKAWAAELKKKGVERITGDLVVDDSYFDGVRFLPGWKESQQGSWYEAEVSALNFNDNCVGVTAKAGATGQPAKVELSPLTSFSSVDNRSRTVDGPKAIPRFDRRNGSNTIIVSGEISSKQKTSTELNHITVEDPALYFGTVLAETLRAEGIAVGGKVVRGKVSESAGPSPQVLVTHRSTLADDLKVINKHSQNLHAEVLLKAIGARKGGEGSIAGGGRAVAAFLKAAGIPATGFQLEDGSGLSAGNRVCPATLAGVLSWIERQPYFRLYRDSLPIAGVDGTLKKRFKGKRCSTHVFAKTGYLNGASALSGYVEKGTKSWVFSVVVNGLRGDLQDAKALEEEVPQAVYDAMP